MNPRKNKQKKVQECICHSNTLIGLIVNNVYTIMITKALLTRNWGGLEEETRGNYVNLKSFYHKGSLSRMSKIESRASSTLRELEI